MKTATTWNYRVARYDDGTLSLHKLYYDDQGMSMMMVQFGHFLER